MNKERAMNKNEIKKKTFSSKKLIGQIHLWLGLTSGLIVFIIGSTGCIYVFEEELRSLFHQQRMYVEVPENSVKKPVTELYETAQNIVGKDHPIQQIEIPTDANRSYVFKPAVKKNKHALTYFGEVEYYHILYINPYTGALIKNENAKLEFFNVTLALHRYLLLKKDIGTSITGISVLIFVIMLITGIVLWWPKNKGMFKQRMSLKWKDTTKWKRKNYDLHTILGFYGFVFALTIALTGLTWSFQWFENTVSWVANGGIIKKTKPMISDTLQTVTHKLPMDSMINVLEKQNPQAKLFSVNFPKEKKATLNVQVYDNEQLSYNRKQYQFDQYSGELLKATRFEEKNAGEKMKAMNYDIHVGRMLHLPGKVLAFFVALIVASLPISGFLIWYGRQKKAKI